MDAVFYPRLSDGHVKTALLDFVLDIATSQFALVAQHLGENPLQRVVTHGALHGLVAIIADVERGAVKMAGVLRSVGIVSLQAGDVFHGTQQTGNDELLHGYALLVEAVEERLTDVL